MSISLLHPPIDPLSPGRSARLPDGPILVVDSGLGGLTVAAALRKRLPAERLVYVGDTARVPYGSKSPEAIVTACTQVIAAALDRLKEKGGPAPKHIVIACNSASAVALPALRERFSPTPVTGVIDAGARAAARAAGNRVRATIGVIATEATIRSRAYNTAILRRRPRAHVLLKPTPLLVPLVEEARAGDDPLVRLALEQYLHPLMRRAEQLSRYLDVLVLGCTHYPLLMDPIRRTVGYEVAIVDSASACAEDVATRLTTAGLLRAQADHADRKPTIQVFATDLPHRFGRLARRFLGEEIAAPELLCVDDGPVSPVPLAIA